VGYYAKTLIGALLFLGALVAFNVALLKLLDTGTCASGNTPYVIANPCPSDTGKWVGLLVGSIFGGMLGAAIFAFRGDRPGRENAPLNGLFGWGSFAWGLFFAGTGIVALVGSLTMDDDGSGGKLGGLIVGVTFALMGLPVLFVSLRSAVKHLLSGPERGQTLSMGEQANAAAAAASGGGGGDVIDQISRLDELRRSGALTQSEFEREKAKLLAGN
jgi:putative oligomerization/nucleic acid binding protein